MQASLADTSTPSSPAPSQADPAHPASPDGIATPDESASPDGQGLLGSTAVQALHAASRAFVGLTARSIAAVEGDVTLPQFRALVVIATRGPQRSLDIAEELQVNPSTGTRMCDRLIRKGLARRVRSTTDRRAVRLRLTEAGHDIVDQVITRRRAELERLVAETTHLWQPAVTDALLAFASAAGEADEQDWWLGWSTNATDPADDFEA